MPHLRPVDLQDRVALVTGATGEVGAAFTDLLGSAGAEVAVAGETGPALERMAIRLGVETVEADPADPRASAAAAAAIAERLGRLDVLVCVLGSAVDPDAALAALREVGPTLASGGRGGRIVLVVGPESDVAPGAIAESAAELAAAGVTFNAIFHGRLRPPESDEWDEDDQATAIGTVGASDVARAALWLLDPEVMGVTGSVLDLDVRPEGGE